MMALSKVDFGKMLAVELCESHDLVKLSRWAYEIFLENQKALDPKLREVLLDLSRIEDSPEFEYTIDELKNLAKELQN